MKKLFISLVGDVKSLGNEIVYASFTKLILKSVFSLTLALVIADYLPVEPQKKKVLMLINTLHTSWTCLKRTSFTALLSLVLYVRVQEPC
jgi:hypothetical protein